MERLEAYLILNSLRLIGPVRVRKLMERFGSVEQILLQSTSSLASVEGVGQKAAESIRAWEQNFDLAGELAELQRLGIGVIDREDERYPQQLLEIYDPPLLLYYKGDLEAAKRRGIGVVGSRQTSHYGLETAKKLSYQMAYAGLPVVSGLARGIDTAAHQGALAAKGRTVAVLGCSLDLMYPPENQALAEMIVEKDGLLLSEFPLKTPPDKQTFPMRNRVVSGLSGGVLVVEAGAESGALITARMALDQGRQVFAIPGRIDNPLAKGCHRLIKDGAKLVESVEDVLAEFEFLFPPAAISEPRRVLPADLSEDEQVILKNLGMEEVHLDELTRKCGLPSARMSSTLLRLEMRKLVRQLPGKFFVKTD
ncbi:MAG: DNA-processing protein DprA [Verrucomicrobiales bacterium]|jgi:DNA processing protein|nr:DNA-processing protein DprA [Verrucomicrobiales bacterium]